MILEEICHCTNNLHRKPLYLQILYGFAQEVVCYELLKMGNCCGSEDRDSDGPDAVSKILVHCCSVMCKETKL